MRLPMRDLIATGVVAVAGLIYALWAVDLAPWGMSSVRMSGLAILALGSIASASAVVLGFEQLIRGNRVYLSVTSLIGLAAFAAGIWMLVTSSEIGLGLLVGTMGGLWLISTVHHSLIAGAGPKAELTATTLHITPAERREAA